MPTPNFFYLIGKPIVEKYGRFKGRIVALEFDTNGELTNVVYENGGVILSKNKNSLVIEEDKVIIVNPDLIRAKKVIGKMGFLKLQLDTIEKIRNISPDSGTFISLLNNLKSEFESIKSEVNSIVKRLESRKRDIERRKTRIEHLFYWLNVAKNANGLDNKVYMDSFEVLDRELVKLNAELEELEYTLLNLSSKVSDLEDILNKYSNRVEESADPHLDEAGDGGYVEEPETGLPDIFTDLGGGE